MNPDDYEDDEPETPLFDDDQGSLAMSLNDLLDLQIEREERARRQRHKAENEALDRSLRGIDLTVWYADNTGASHAPVLPKVAPMTPIDTRPVDPYLGVGNITEIMRRPQDESRVNKEGNSVPGGGSGSFNGGGKAKKMPTKVVPAGPQPERAELPVTMFKIGNLTEGERHILEINVGVERMRDLLQSHVQSLILGTVPFVPSHSSPVSPLRTEYCRVYGLDEIEIQILHKHAGSARRAIIEYIHARYGDAISRYDAESELALAI